MLLGTRERYEFKPLGRVAHEKGLEDLPTVGYHVYPVKLGDAAVLDHHPGEVRATEPHEHLSLAVRLVVGRLLEEAGLEGVDEDSLHVALWRRNAGAWRLEHGMRPLTPQALGSHAVLVAVHPEGMEAVLGEDGAKRLSLTVDNATLATTSSGYHLTNRGGDPRLLVLLGTRRSADAGHWEPAQRAVAVGRTERRARWRALRTRPHGLLPKGPPQRGSGRYGLRTRPRQRAVGWMWGSRWRQSSRGSGLWPARRLRHRCRETARAKSVAHGWRMTGLASQASGRSMTWSEERRKWRTGPSPRRGRWKLAGTGPRGGACGQTHAASLTLSPRCRR